MYNVFNSIDCRAGGALQIVGRPSVGAACSIPAAYALLGKVLGSGECVEIEFVCAGSVSYASAVIRAMLGRRATASLPNTAT
jgi:hypothetical protein